MRHGGMNDALGPIAELELRHWKSRHDAEHSLWRFSRALHRALNERQFDELAADRSTSVDWAIYGPIDMFPFLGARRGKAACSTSAGRSPTISLIAYDREAIMLGVDRPHR